jgi:RNA-dependent RNA polymerase
MAWEEWTELVVRVDNLPGSTTCAELHANFSKEGSVNFLDILKGESRVSSKSARVRFAPPPPHPFWEDGLYTFRLGSGQLVRVEVRLEQPKLASEHKKMILQPSGDMKMILQPSCMEMGVLLDPRTMMSMVSIKQSMDLAVDDDLNLRIEVDPPRKKITISFPRRIRTTVGLLENRPYRCIVNFKEIKVLYRSNLEAGAWCLVLSLPCPPVYALRDDSMNDAFDATRSTWSRSNFWNRVTGINGNEFSFGSGPISLNTHTDSPGFIDIGRWTTFRFTMKGEGQGALIQRVLHDYNINTEMVPDFNVVPGSPSVLWSLLDPPELVGRSGTHDLSFLADASTPPVDRLPFELRYQLEVCISKGILNEHCLDKEFLNKLARLDPTKARLLLEYIADQGQKIYEPLKIFKENNASCYYLRSKVPHYCTMSRKVTVTPTTLVLSSPTVEASNRVVRRYSTIQDRFIRVQFTDELSNGRLVSHAGGMRGEDVFKRVYRATKDGIKIGGRTYEFLAFGNSQIRECGAFFFCPTDHVTCDDIRAWMGDFSHIKAIAKYAARLGQCFSTTREIRGVIVPNICSIPDIERNGYNFTDGVGKISKFLAEMVMGEMRLRRHDLPSAFQFRMGGCKGVLAVWPGVKNMEVHIRKSQEKFKSTFNGLEIVRCSSFSVATLNRQTITILSCLGVPEEVFLRLLETQVTSYEKAMGDVDEALSLLQKYIDENQVTLAMADMLRSGFMDGDVQEPFVLTILNLWKIWSMKLLKEKARIVVENGAFVLGCVDETGILRGHSQATEGNQSTRIEDLPQIFLQIPDCKDRRKAIVITGPCIVGRNPSLHPGDIRVVEAVDVPALRHLHNVVVFSQLGDRDVPSMLSGGDLDGDDFFVIWDQDLLPREWNHPPMPATDLTSRPLEVQGRDVNADDLRSFFVDYMKTDALGKIALAHLAHADQYESGAKHPKCKSSIAKR